MQLGKLLREKLPGDHIDFNLNLKYILPLLFDPQKDIYFKKVCTWNCWFLVLIFFFFFHSTLPFNMKYRDTREQKLWVKSIILQFTDLLKNKTNY